MQHRIASFARRWRRRWRWRQHMSHCRHAHLCGRIGRTQVMQRIMMMHSRGWTRTSGMVVVIVMGHWSRGQWEIQKIIINSVCAEVQAQTVRSIESLVAIRALKVSVIQSVQTHRIRVDGLVIVVVYYVMIRAGF